MTVLEIASCGSPFKNLFEAAATTFVNGTALQAGVAGLELGLCWSAVAAPVTALRLQHNSLLSYALTWRPACLWTEAWHSVADLAGLLAAIACQRQPMTFAQNSICNNLLEKYDKICRHLQIFRHMLYHMSYIGRHR